MASAIGKFIDQANIAVAAFDEVEKAVIKATRHNDEPPKEKHVRKIIVWCSSIDIPPQNLLLSLLRRLEQPDWIVVMKTLIVFHRLFTDAPNLMKGLIALGRTRPGRLFALQEFKDPTETPEAASQSQMIRKYSLYLEERVNVFKSTDVEFDKDTKNLVGASSEDLLKRIPRLQSLINALLNTRFHAKDCHNPIPITAFGLLLKDSFKLYSCLNDGIVNMVERYFTMTKEQCKEALSYYQVFCKETDSIGSLYRNCKHFVSYVPELPAATLDLVPSLEEHLKELDKPAAERSTAGNKATKAKMQEMSAVTKQEQPTNLFDLDFGSIPVSTGMSSAPAPAPAAAAFDPFGSAPAAPVVRAVAPVSSMDPFAPMSTSPAAPAAAASVFDPFGAAMAAPVLQPVQQELSADQKLANILKVQSMAPPAAAAPPMSFGGPALNPFGIPQQQQQQQQQPFMMGGGNMMMGGGMPMQQQQQQQPMMMGGFNPFAPQQQQQMPNMMMQPQQQQQWPQQQPMMMQQQPQQQQKSSTNPFDFGML